MSLTIPEGYQTVMPYLIVENAQQLINFMKLVFDAEQVAKYADPDRGIMHAEMRIGGSLIMLADSTAEWTAQPAGLFVYVPDADATYQKALAAGATSIMPPSDKEYGRSAGVRDLQGNTWWITSAA